MHDLDRTQLEIGENLEGFDAGEFDSENGFEFEPEFDSESIFDEATEMELATELLSVSSEQELDQFLGNLIKRASRAVGSFVKSPTFRAIGGALKGLAKKALPIAGTALGTYFGGPLGASIGGKLGTLGASLIKEAELVGLSADEREFEIARNFVRLAGNAVQKLANIPAVTPPIAAANRALAQAAGILSSSPAAAGVSRALRHPGRRYGRWIRRGRNIVVLGA